jgi:hypothetical protein
MPVVAEKRESPRIKKLKSNDENYGLDIAGADDEISDVSEEK